VAWRGLDGDDTRERLALRAATRASGS
jgi:hypothetical protein